MNALEKASSLFIASIDAIKPDEELVLMKGCYGEDFTILTDDERELEYVDYNEARVFAFSFGQRMCWNTHYDA